MMPDLFFLADDGKVSDSNKSVSKEDSVCTTDLEDWDCYLLIRLHIFMTFVGTM
jgi:hypothetical protein